MWVREEQQAEWNCSYFIWKYLKATWIKQIANEGCNYEHIKCFENFLQTFKHKDVVHPWAYLPQNIKHRRQNYQRYENKTRTNWNNFPQVIKFLSSISWLCSCRPVLPQGFNETYSLPSKLLSKIFEKSLSKKPQTNHTKNFYGACLDVTWFHASCCFSCLSSWSICLSGLGLKPYSYLQTI